MSDNYVKLDGNISLEIELLERSLLQQHLNYTQKHIELI